MALMHPSTPSTTNTKQGPSTTFTGAVHLDVLHSDPTEGIMIGHVLFTPSARTFWHTHERGQLLRVLAGSGWVCEKDTEPQKLATGDTVWCPPGTEHWHGADEGSYMVHLAVSHGKTQWGREVSGEEFAARK